MVLGRDDTGDEGPMKVRPTRVNTIKCGAGEQEQENSGTLDADGKLQITLPTTVSKQRRT